MLINSNEYLNIVESIKQEIRTAQYRATVSVNRELLVLYHSIGEVINEHKTWGNKFVENLAADIKIDTVIFLSFAYGWIQMLREILIWHF